MILYLVRDKILLLNKMNTKEMNDTLPDCFFKYMKVEHLLKTIENNTIWFSSPKQFNDPFDCDVSLINFTPPKKDIGKIINEKLSANRAIRRKEIKKNKQNPFRIKNQMAEQTQNIFYNSGVCCFSEVEDNTLMWAHYADNHNGVCLKFSSSISKIATMTAKVKYQTNFEKELFFTDDAYAIYHLIFTKSDNWIYEKEIRAFQMLKTGETNIDVCDLTEIIFGCKMNKAVKLKIIELVKSKGYNHIKFKEVLQTKSSFNIKIVNI